MKQTTTQFQFTAKPKVTALKPKYRQRDDDRMESTNLMNDPRIIRGNTYAAIIANKNEIQPPPMKKTATVKQQPKRKLQQRRINFDTGFEPSTPRAVDGRDHFTTQTQPFVQTLRDKPIQYQKECQTDLYLDRPAQRSFNPMAEKTGMDKTTQVDENDPQLFNFDYEVQPILQALLSKVIQTSRMQLYQQGQMKEKQKQKIQYEKRRHILLAEAQQLQANQNRHRDEYQRRQLQYRKAKQQESFAEKKVISRILSKQYLKNLQQNTELVLEHNGFFRSPLELDLLQEFLPWLYDQILGQMKEQNQFMNETKNMAQQSKEDVLKESQSNINKQKQRRNQIFQQRQKKAEQKRARKEAKRLQKQAQEQRRRQEQQEAAKAAQQNNAQAPPPAQ